MKSSKYLRIPQYEVRGYPENETEKVCRLFSDAFGGRTLSAEMLRWQMDENPCLKKRATSLWDGEILVAYNALTPAKALYEGREIYTAVSGTTMADEKYAGVSVQLFKECRKRNQDIEIIIGFPNHNAYGVSVRYSNHRYVGDVAFWSCPVKELETKTDIREILIFTEEHGELWRNVADQYQYIKIRDKNYLNWRFFHKPEYDYSAYELVKAGKVCGYMVADIYVECGMKQLQIVDLLAVDDESMSVLLGYSLNLGYQKGCGIVKAWMTSKHHEKIFLDAGFTYGEHPFAMTVWDKNLVIEESYLTMCDSDIF